MSSLDPSTLSTDPRLRTYESEEGLPCRLEPVVDDDGLHQLVVAHHQVVGLAHGEAPALR